MFKRTIIKIIITLPKRQISKYHKMSDRNTYYEILEDLLRARLIRDMIRNNRRNRGRFNRAPSLSNQPTRTRPRPRTRTTTTTTITTTTDETESTTTTTTTITTTTTTTTTEPNNV